MFNAFSGFLLLLVSVLVFGCSSTPEHTSCDLGGGRECPAGSVCADSQGCNVCGCDGQTGELECTAAACTDPSPTECTSNADCGDKPCVYDMGCDDEAVAWCAQVGCVVHSAEPREFCGCDGQTFTAPCPDRPYRSVGACP